MQQSPPLDAALTPQQEPPHAAAPAPSSPQFSLRWLAALALGLCYPLFFFQLGGWGLVDPDEGRYAEVAREMLARHDWVTPTLNYVKFFDKPPLLYWSIAASYSVFGTNEWAARLVPALAALLGLAMTLVLGRRMFGPRAGFLGALILATSLMWPVMARFVLTDMLVSSLVFCALGFWWLGHTAATSEQRRAFLGFWVVLALAVLTKGPVAVVLVGGTISGYLLLCRGWKSLAPTTWIWGVPLFLALAAPWFVVVALRNPEFNHFFWYEQHFGRFLGDRAIRDHVNGPFYLLELLPLLFFPWSVFAPVALWTSWRKLWPARSQRQRATIFLIGGCVWITLFFSVSDSKIVTYILPVLPMLALLTGAFFDQVLSSPKAPRALLVSAGVLALLLALAGLAAIVLGPRNLRLVGVSQLWAFAIAALLMVWALALAGAAWRRETALILSAVAGGFTLVFTGGVLLVTAIAPAVTSAPMFKIIEPGLNAGAQVATASFVHSAGFYTRRRVYVEGAPHELIFGLQRLNHDEKRRWFFKGNAGLRVLMARAQPTYGILQMSPQERKATLQSMNGQAVQIAENERFSVIANRAALELTPANAARQ